MALRSLSAVLALVLLAAPVSADEAAGAEQASARLATASGEGLLQAAYATCLELGNKADAATEAFRKAGWSVEGDAETGFYESAGPEDLFALTWADGGFCLIQSETIGSARAAELLAGVLAEAGLTAAPSAAEAGGECPTLALAQIGAMVEVTSSGNDPVCVSSDNSGVSFTWATEE
ncbi:hypothetical protein HOY34_02575 [Xinfangfangia sp. D13-10-4-6]|uniref:hypothetical protein n=1 Tax=Pseudogemmobacter hezensis TaxID=2737662 RepID=UPI00155702FD|nr:hypothetical protein [Pseudogemmobacter hezensis]NPD14082.1 hypothetical protein [Pseudogemmobacter hezensis]